MSKKTKQKGTKPQSVKANPNVEATPAPTQSESKSSKGAKLAIAALTVSILSLATNLFVWIDNDSKWRDLNLGRLSLAAIDFVLTYKAPSTNLFDLKSSGIPFGRLVSNPKDPNESHWELTICYALVEKSSQKELANPSRTILLSLADAENERMIAAQKRGISTNQIEIKRKQTVLAKFKNVGKTPIRDLRIWHNGYALDVSNVWWQLRFESFAKESAMYLGELQPEQETFYQVRMLSEIDDGLPSSFVFRHVATYQVEPGNITTNEFFSLSELKGDLSNNAFQRISSQRMSEIRTKARQFVKRP